jgi:hypothetical protein
VPEDLNFTNDSVTRLMDNKKVPVFLVTCLPIPYQKGAYSSIWTKLKKD